jgi:hypothetical protein
MLSTFRALDGWTKTVVLFMWGSVFIGKSSAYLGLAIGGVLLLSNRVLWDRWFLALTRRADPLHSFCWALLVSLLYGFGETAFGLLLGYRVTTTLQILVFNICPVYVLLGIWAGLRYPTIVHRYIRFVAWYVVFYTPLYFLVLKHVTVNIGGDPLWASPGTGSVQLIGLLAFEAVLAKMWLPILVLTCLIIVNQGRADWMGLMLALGVWGKLSRRMARVCYILGFVAMILVIAALADIKLPPIPGRGGELSARGTVSRIAGAFSAETAASVSEDGHAGFYYGTVYWRKRWWEHIRNEVFQHGSSTAFGMGYGYPLAKLASREVEKQGTRSPHSILYFTLAYSGFVGVALFFWLQLATIRLLYKAHRRTGGTFALAYYAYSVSGSFFGNFIETPAGITFYLILGLCVGPMFATTEQEEYLATEFEPEYEYEAADAYEGVADLQPSA